MPKNTKTEIKCGMRYLNYIFIGLLMGVSAFAEQKDLKTKKSSFSSSDIDIFRVLGEIGNADSQLIMGQVFRDGLGVPKNNKEAFRWFSMAADQGDSVSQYNFGLFGLSRNMMAPDVAVGWLTKAASGGHVGAQSVLGDIYFNGKFSVQINNRKAVQWFNKAATQRDTFSMVALGYMHLKGVGVPKDTAKSFEFYMRAARMGDADAQHAIASAYRKGTGVKQGLDKSINWERQSAEQGHAIAQFYLGVAHERGLGVMVDIEEAAKWYLKAAEKGIPPAQLNIGNMYFTGTGVAKDKLQSYMWYFIALNQDDEAIKKQVRESMNHTKGEMTQAMIQKAREMAHVWLQKKKGDHRP
jgi:hypothetical protein